MRVTKPRPRGLALLGAVTLTLLLSFLALAARTDTGQADPTIDATEQRFLELLNEYRQVNGKGTLSLNLQLNAAADWMSTDMGINRYFGHVDSLGRTPPQRVQAFGYPGGIGENIAGGFSSAESVFEAWKGSAGHNYNLLYSGYTVIGIGRVAVPGSPYGTYWTTDFGGYSGPGVTPSPTPTPPPATPATTASPTATAAPPPTATPPATPTPVPTPAPTAPPTAAPTSTPTTSSVPIQGDANCDRVVSSMDALEILNMVAHLSTALPCGGAGDTNCDGRVTAVDALRVLRYVLGMPAQSPPGCDVMGMPLGSRR